MKNFHRYQSFLNICASVVPLLILPSYQNPSGNSNPSWCLYWKCSQSPVQQYSQVELEFNLTLVIFLIELAYWISIPLILLVYFWEILMTSFIPFLVPILVPMRELQEDQSNILCAKAVNGELLIPSEYWLILTLRL